MGVVQNHFYQTVIEITPRKKKIAKKEIYYGTQDILRKIMM